jgi:ATP phosphoribosyltransferase
MAASSTAAGASPAPRTLRMALPKGALYAESVSLLDRAGYDVTGLAEPDRKLVVRTADFEYIIARPTDIPVYIAYGGVDVAIAGRDVLIEAGLDVAELLDLRFGGCRFVVAEAEDAGSAVSERLRHLGVLRVGTKYPRITEEYFAEKGQQVEVIKLHGNVELAPLIGLADRIVDITATGRTLAENRLRIVGEVLASTARLVANPVSAKTEPERIRGLAERLAAVLPAVGEECQA